MKGLVISAVAQDSAASKLGLRPGDRLIAVNGAPVRDVIDYYFLLAAEEPVLALVRDGHEFRVALSTDPSDVLGLSFSRPFGRIRRCGNRCVFCFVDQQPPGLRATLRFKDDDYRLSFWEGNFVTLSNCTQADLKRIITQRLSPLYVSVHTTNPELRSKMMGNPRAGRIYEQLRILAAGGITLHTQVVLCPGLNDREELTRTVSDLISLNPGVRSVAIVPVGLTRHRQTLFPLRSVNPQEAAQVLGTVEQYQKECLKRYKSRIVFAADEFYILAGKTVPPAREYEGFPQMENGVGLMRRFLDPWPAIERRLPPEAAPRRVVIITGVMAENALSPVVSRLNRVEGLQIELLPVTNRFFGPCVTVAGLLTGQDILKTLEGVTKPDLVLIPAAALKEQAVFLDGLTLDTLEAAAGCPVIPADSPHDLIKALSLKLLRRQKKK
ncbi:MAG: DUF512 domain-containing protein [Bacillota bacterium]